MRIFLYYFSKKTKSRNRKIRHHIPINKVCHPFVVIRHNFLKPEISSMSKNKAINLIKLLIKQKTEFVYKKI